MLYSEVASCVGFIFSLKHVRQKVQIVSQNYDDDYQYSDSMMNDVMMKMGAVYITVNTDNTTGALSGLDVSPGNDGQNLGDGE